MSDKECPNCGRFNAEAALQCDCGHDFGSAQSRPPHPQGGQVTQGKKFGTRAGAYVIDFVVLMVVNTGIAAIIGMVLGIAMAILRQDVVFNEQSMQVLDWFLGLALFSLYFTLYEGLFGATAGKLIFGMRVVKMDGRPCGLGAALIRALLRFLDGLFFGLVALGSMKPPLQQRLGDKAAKTLVVGSKDEVIQQHRPWWLLLIATLLYFILATAALGAVLILSLE